MSPPPWLRIAVALMTACALMPAIAQPTSASAQLQRWQAAAGAPADAARGQKLFNTKAGNELSCVSCHGNPPTGPARHASTGKPIDALAPAFNPQRFSDQAKVDKWFRRNCKDVFERECSAPEKADLMAYLLSLKK